MAKKTVYIETTIPSMYFNTRSARILVTRGEQTKKWWDAQRQNYELFTSAAVIEELSRGAHPSRDDKIHLLAAVPELLITRELHEIAAFYCRQKMMPRDTRGDALHLAVASYYKCDILLTWNCKHLANIRKLGHISRLNALLGLAVPELLTPFQLMERGEIHEEERRND